MTEPSPPRSALFLELARVAKALGSDKRLELVDLLVQRPGGVVELAEAAGLNVTTTSAHLQVLKQVGLVVAVRNGTTVRHHIASPEVIELYATLVTVAAAQSPAVDVAARRYLGSDDHEDIEAVNRDELIRRVEEGRAIVLDVRPTEEYAAGHIPGAVSIPMPELADRIGELSSELDVVAYCRGRYCAFSHEAVRFLTEHGFRAFRLTNGVLEWKINGHPLVEDPC